MDAGKKWVSAVFVVDVGVKRVLAMVLVDVRTVWVSTAFMVDVRGECYQWYSWMQGGNECCQ